MFLLMKYKLVEPNYYFTYFISALISINKLNKNLSFIIILADFS